MLVGIVSDTHVGTRIARLPQDVPAALAGVDLILHAGDLVDPRVLRELRNVAPVVAVAGNCDHGHLPEKTVVQAGNHVIGLVHRPPRVLGEDALKALFGEPVACVVCGHTHRSAVERHSRVLLLNPGSPVFPLDGVRSIALLAVGEQLVPQIVALGTRHTGD
jgi:hypothetical protein